MATCSRFNLKISRCKARSLPIGLTPMSICFLASARPSSRMCSTQAVPLLFLGCVFVFNGALYCLLLVFLASALARRLKANETFSSLIGRLTGALFVFLGIKLALQKA